MKQCDVLMTELDVIKYRFERTFRHRPSTIRTTLFYGPVGWILRIAGYTLIILGVVFLIGRNTGLIKNTIVNDGTVNGLKGDAVLGAAGIVFGMIVIWIGNLCYKIVQRNIYILELEDVFSDHRDE